MKQQISATIIKDSIERIGNNRITTFKLTYPRMIHAELLTHAMLKSNSASSRAIPFKRMVEMVENDPFIPNEFLKEHKGMQGFESFKGEDYGIAVARWILGSREAVKSAKFLNDFGVTKQLCNRILEPFLWHTIILTGTEFENFFALRAHPMAEIHLQDLAYKILDAMNNSTPKELKCGEWHIPFEDDIDVLKVKEVALNLQLKPNQVRNLFVDISTAISAQISYLKFGSNDYKDLLDLHDCLLERPYIGKRGVLTKEDPIHASPASHCAQAMTEYEYTSFFKGKRYSGNQDLLDGFGWCHNLRGFKSYRSMLPNENSKDSRLLKNKHVIFNKDIDVLIESKLNRHIKMEKLLLQFIEVVKKDKKVFNILENAVVTGQQYELASALRDIKKESFPVSEWEKQAKEKAKEIKCLLSLIDLNVTEEVCWIIYESIKLHEEKKGQFCLADANTLKIMKGKLYE